MPIYELRDDAIRPIQPTSFAQHNVRESHDLQRLLRSAIDVVTPGTMVLAEEFGEWEESFRRIDLLALDEQANLVVIELKRDDDGAHMELQAIRYAAMVSTMTFARAVDVHQRYLARIGHPDANAREAILDFLGWSEPNEDEFAQDVRIVLAAANFSKEITTAVMWLNDRQLDIRCVRIQPYELSGRLLLDVQQIIPLPEAASYQVQIKEKAAEKRVARLSGEGPDFTRYDLRIGETTYPGQWKRNMLYLVVRAAIDAGATREMLDEVPERKWLVVDGNAPDQCAFEAAAQAKLGAERRYDPRRWFTKDEQLFRDATSTFALSNQWDGAEVLAAVDAIAARVGLAVAYEAVNARV